MLISTSRMPSEQIATKITLSSRPEILLSTVKKSPGWTSSFSSLLSTIFTSENKFKIGGSFTHPSRVILPVMSRLLSSDIVMLSEPSKSYPPSILDEELYSAPLLVPSLSLLVESKREPLLSFRCWVTSKLLSHVAVIFC